ncbi:MAG: hypothetical protein ACR652_22410 [Methylocystis sp.]|uniref:hypothetical protein n=1 Tax=Methylocystis sp. TaxID=1911079 RepID=UPI003DA35CA4
MGEVIAFRMRGTSSREMREPPTGGAQILFFLGVRYIRMDDPLQTCDSRAPGGRPRGGGKRKGRARA